MKLNLVREGLLLAFLPRSDDTDHLPVAGVVHQAEVAFVDGVVDADDVAPAY